jgi:threonine/homoserine efflux transporter RhtA
LTPANIKIIFLQERSNMKKIMLTLTGLVMILSLVQCASTVATVNPKVAACKSGCNTAYDSCITKAGKSESKKAACNVAKDKCYSDCDAKAN